MTIDQQLALAILFSLFLSIGSLTWLWIQSGKPTRELTQIQLLRSQLSDEMARNDKLGIRSDRLLGRIEQLEAEQEISKEAREIDCTDAAEMRQEVEELKMGVMALIAQLEQANLTPVYRPSLSRSKERDLVHGLVEKIALQFNLEEINSLAFDCNINPEEFAGETRSSRARELVEIARRTKKYRPLQSRIQELRPDKEEE